MKVEPLERTLKQSRDSEISHTDGLNAELADLKHALETMMQRIETGEDIMEHLERIEGLSQALTPTETPRMLLHYLERKSYTKALAFLKTLTVGGIS